MRPRVAQRIGGAWHGWDEWPAAPMLGAVSAVSDHPGDDDAPVLLVPDGAGGYREHVVGKPPKRRLGFGT